MVLFYPPAEIFIYLYTYILTYIPAYKYWFIQICKTLNYTYLLHLCITRLSKTSWLTDKMSIINGTFYKYLFIYEVWIFFFNSYFIHRIYRRVLIIFFYMYCMKENFGKIKKLLIFMLNLSNLLKRILILFVLTEYNNDQEKLIKKIQYHKKESCSHFLKHEKFGNRIICSSFFGLMEIMCNWEERITLVWLMRWL